MVDKAHSEPAESVAAAAAAAQPPDTSAARAERARAELEVIAFMQLGSLADASAAMVGAKRAALVDLLRLEGADGADNAAIQALAVSVSAIRDELREIFDALARPAADDAAGRD